MTAKVTMNKIFSVLFFCVLSGFSKKNSENDSIPYQKIAHHIERSLFFSRSAPDSALFYIEKAEKNALLIKNDSLDARIRVHKSGIYILNQRYDEAEVLLKQNAAIENLAPTTLGMTLQNFGNLYYYRQDFKNAIDYYINASEVFEELKDSLNLSKVFTNIGSINAQLKSPKRAILYLTKALNYAGKNEMLKMQILANISAVYSEEKQIDKAILTMNEAEKIAIKLKATVYYGTIYSNLCNYHLEKKEYDIAIEYGVKGLEARKKLHQNTDILTNNLGFAFLQKGNAEKALPYFNKIVASSTGELKLLVYKNLSKAHQNLKNYKESLAFSNQYNSLKDSLNSLEQQVHVTELIEKYESEKKQQQIDILNTKDQLNLAKLKEQRSIIWAIGLFSILILAVGFLWYRNQKTKQSLENVVLQHKLLQTQLNPHFLFHALNSIQAFIYQNKKEESNDYLSSFSKLMRSILESSNEDFITVKEDVEAIGQYLHLQQLNFNKKFTYTIIADHDLDAIKIPPMFTQPFVENALLHGIKNKEKGIVEIKYVMTTDKLHVHIIDNGEGIGQAQKSENSLHRSMGTEIIRKRMDTIFKTHSYKITIDTKSSVGFTEICLTFPLENNL